MRVLLVNTCHYRGGGDSTYTLNLADLLRSKGQEVAFFAMQDGRNLPDPNADLFVSHIDFREMNRAKSIRTGLQVLTRAIYSVEARRRFSLLLDRFQPDIVHLQNFYAHITPSIIFEAKQRGLPLVWTLHDHKLICPNTHCLIDTTGEICEACGSGAYYRAALRRCKKGSLLASSMAALEAYAHRLMRVREQVDAFLVPSLFLKDKLLSRGFPPRRLHHLPLFLPPDRLQDGTENDGYLLFLGKMAPIKGIRPLLQASGLARETELRLAGHADESLAAELPSLLPPNASYVGFKEGKELQQLLARALAVVVPSLCYENQPFSILEAFASSKPVIASRLGGMVELVPHGERGLLVAPGAALELADAMSWMGGHAAEVTRMGHTAREYVEREHGAEAHYQRLMDIYVQVATRNMAVRGHVGEALPQTAGDALSAAKP